MFWLLDFGVYSLLLALCLDVLGFWFLGLDFTVLGVLFWGFSSLCLSLSLFGLFWVFRFAWSYCV